MRNRLKNAQFRVLGIAERGRAASSGCPEVALGEKKCLTAYVEAVRCILTASRKPKMEIPVKSPMKEP